jgi:predicted metal-dependent peptidase
MREKELEKLNENFGDKDQNGKKWEDYETIVCPDGQVIDMVKLLDEQQRAKAALVHIIPYFGGFINKLKPIYTFMIPTQAVDGKHLFINPQFTYNMDLTGKVFVMAHEIMHCVLNHLRRGKAHDPEKSNIAADYEVNVTLENMGLVKSDVMQKLGALYDRKYSGWGYEKIYADNPSKGKDNSTMDNSKQSNQAQKNSDQNSNGGNGDSNQQYSADYKAGWNKAMEDYKAGKLKL